MFGDVHMWGVSLTSPNKQKARYTSALWHKSRLHSLAPYFPSIITEGMQRVIMPLFIFAPTTVNTLGIKFFA